jgi:hypothetical protein
VLPGPSGACCEIEGAHRGGYKFRAIFRFDGSLRMKVCSDFTVEAWSPDFSSSSQANPRWTRVRWSGIDLCNSLEWADWMRNPVQVRLCDACGCQGCAHGNYVHISNLGDFVLWTTPQVDTRDDWEKRQNAPLPALGLLGAVAIPPSTWEQWRVLAPQLPEAPALPKANGLALAEAWILGEGRPTNIQELLPMLRARLLGCDTLEPSEAIERVQRWMERLSVEAATPVAGFLRAPEEVGARVETLYFDGPSEHEWPALAIRGNTDFLLLDREHAFVPL